MHRFFVAPESVGEGTLRITGEDYKHLSKVLRIGPGEAFEVCDGQGTEHICIIDQDDGSGVDCRITETKPCFGENTLRVTLFQGLPKGQKMDDIIQKSVELGVNGVIPFSSKRTVVDLRDKGKKKAERWNKIAYAAAKQSKRGIIPAVHEPLTMGAVLEQIPGYDLFLVAYEDERGQGLAQVLTSGEEKPMTMGILVGPEGGLAQEEVTAMTAAGARSISLGRRILRTETAGPAVLASLNLFYELVEFGCIKEQ